LFDPKWKANWIAPELFLVKKRTISFKVNGPCFTVEL
jgi:hypothetical protein